MQGRVHSQHYEDCTATFWDITCNRLRSQPIFCQTCKAQYTPSHVCLAHKRPQSKRENRWQCYICTSFTNDLQWVQHVKDIPVKSMMLLDKWDLVQSGMQPLKHSAEFAHWYHWQDDICNIRHILIWIQFRYLNRVLTQILWKISWLTSSLVGALSPVNHKGIYQG